MFGLRTPDPGQSKYWMLNLVLLIAKNHAVRPLFVVSREVDFRHHQYPVYAPKKIKRKWRNEGECPVALLWRMI